MSTLFSALWRQRAASHPSSHCRTFAAFGPYRTASHGVIWTLQTATGRINWLRRCSGRGSMAEAEQLMEDLLVAVQDCDLQEIEVRNQQRRLVTFALLLSVMVGCGAESPPAETAVRREGRTVGTIPANERSTAGAPIPITMKSLMHPVKEGMQVLEQTSERVVFAGQPGDIYSLTLKKGKHGLPEDVTELRSVIHASSEP